MKIKNLTFGLENFLEDRPKLRKYLPQGLTLLFIIFVLGYFTFNAQVNMGNRGIVFGFGFLQQEASFDIQFSLIDYDGSYSYARAYLVGLLNTLLVHSFPSPLRNRVFEHQRFEIASHLLRHFHSRTNTTFVRVVAFSHS